MILVTGGYGFLGSEVCKRLDEEGFSYFRFGSLDFDLRDPDATNKLFMRIQPTYVINVGARLGGIKDNVDNPFHYYSDNLKIGLNVIDQCVKYRVDHLININTACSYPLDAPQPFNEDNINDGLPAEANLYYGLAKRTTMNYSEIASDTFNFKVSNLICTNMFGINDDFNEQTSHVIPALISRFHRAAKEKSPHIDIWGSGKAKREFLHVDDLADGCIHLMKIDEDNYKKNIPDSNSHINVGTGVDIEISELVTILKNISGFKGEIKYDTSKPDGTMRKVLDISLINSLNWESSIIFEDGLNESYKWYLEHYPNVKRS